MTASQQPTCLRTFVWKVISSCNLNCTYCYMYNLADTTYVEQPARMSIATARRAARNVRAHLERHNVRSGSIVLHGGEPLLLKARGLDELLSAISEEINGSPCAPTIGIQSNGLLFTAEIGEVLRKHNVQLGLSIDGIPGQGDVHRVDHGGQPSGARLERTIRERLLPAYRDIWSGFLCVINVLSDPRQTVEYLLSFEPPLIDFLLPLDNHDRRPAEIDEGTRPYASWLLRVLDVYLERRIPLNVRKLEGIIRLLGGEVEAQGALGVGEVNALVVEADGSIELVDSLKSARHGLTKLGASVTTHDFDQALDLMRAKLAELGAYEVPEPCTRCSLLDRCGGGVHPNRYSAARGFRNPSVYCADLQELFRGTWERLHRITNASVS